MLAGDAQVFNNGELKEAIEKNIFEHPSTRRLPNDDQPMPYFIATDDAFALRSWLMKPYSSETQDRRPKDFQL